VAACAGILAAFPTGWRHYQSYVWTRSFNLLISYCDLGRFVQLWLRLSQVGAATAYPGVTPRSAARCAGKVQLPFGIWQRRSLAAPFRPTPWKTVPFDRPPRQLFDAE